jgi:hypothetical protein
VTTQLHQSEKRGRRFGTKQRVYVDPPGEYREIDVALLCHAMDVVAVPLWVVQAGWALTAYAIWKALR